MPGFATGKSSVNRPLSTATLDYQIWWYTIHRNGNELKPCPRCRSDEHQHQKFFAVNRRLRGIFFHQKFWFKHEKTRDVTAPTKETTGDGDRINGSEKNGWINNETRGPNNQAKWEWFFLIVKKHIFFPTTMGQHGKYQHWTWEHSLHDST